MQKLPYVLLFVVLALVVLNIAALRQIDGLEKRVHALEQKNSMAAPAPGTAR
ncbi:MAG: hypothetical protein QM760_20610 [Nibricoccus sp.]